ncbi:hypothetical protein C9J01_28550 [Photobacterium rosenbergii]|uniref:Uncharacterized protein n=1 Tax=Photobacterium rosenbergii TaxID=294936 RepID=A0A2T3MW30_9GAMM|nr:hypothetical protein C9J01_28550 [Photobacterium rosenbergii]
MRGNSHVRFLGGGGAVMRRCYPTCPYLTEIVVKFKNGGESLRFFMAGTREIFLCGTYFSHRELTREKAQKAVRD